MTQDGTGSSSQDLPAALLMRRRIMEGSTISNWSKLEVHGGLSKTGGAADAVDERTPASFSAKAFEMASAVSSSEFGGFSFFCRRTDFRCRHNFFGSPLLSVIFLSQNSLCFRPYNRCFFWACVVQANRSQTSRVLR